MGLDNGFRIQNINPERFKNAPPRKVQDIEETQDGYEVIYFRKCFGIRNSILQVLHAPKNGGDYNVDAEDLPAIFRKIARYLDEEYWDEHGDSIWLYEEILPRLMDTLLILGWLYGEMKNDPNITCTFYDSY